MEIDSTKPPRLWLDGSTGRMSRPIRLDTVGAGHVLTLDCLHTFAIDVSTLADNWGEAALECPLEHVIVQERGKYGEALPVHVISPRLFDQEERLRRGPFRGTAWPERSPATEHPARAEVRPGTRNPGPWKWTEYDAIEDRDGGEVLSVSSGEQWVASDRVRALIAAAPEMETLLRELQAGIDDPTIRRYRIDSLLARLDAAKVAR